MASTLLSQPRAGITITPDESIQFFGYPDETDTDLCDACMMVKPASEVSQTDGRGNTMCDECAEDLVEEDEAAGGAE